MSGLIYVRGTSFMIVDEVIDQRIDEALGSEKAKISKPSTMVLRYFLCQEIGPPIGSGFPALFSIQDLCDRVRRGERTVKNWLAGLERAGIISKRRAGPGKVEIQLQPDFVYTGPLPEDLNDYLEEEQS